MCKEIQLQTCRKAAREMLYRANSFSGEVVLHLGQLRVVRAPKPRQNTR